LLPSLSTTTQKLEVLFELVLNYNKSNVWWVLKIAPDEPIGFGFQFFNFITVVLKSQNISSCLHKHGSQKIQKPVLINKHQITFYKLLVLWQFFHESCWFFDSSANFHKSGSGGH
jgi:hypothetical protein